MIVNSRPFQVCVSKMAPLAMTSLPRRVADACYFREAYRMQRRETQKWLREFQCTYKQDTVVIKKKKKKEVSDLVGFMLFTGDTEQ